MNDIIVKLLETATSNGIWCLLFVIAWLHSVKTSAAREERLLKDSKERDDRIMQENQEREDRYQATIDRLTTNVEAGIEKINLQLASLTGQSKGT